MALTENRDSNGGERIAVLARLPQELAEWLRMRAQRERRSQSQMVEVLLSEAMDEERANAA